MVNFSYDCDRTLKTSWRPRLVSRTSGALLLFLFFLLASVSSFGQAGTACGAHRWDAGDGWRFTNGEWVPTTINGPGLPQGIVACASAAATESNLQQYKSTYTGSNIDFSQLGTCFNHSGTFTLPTVGEDIIWLNFDIRPLAGTYQFQLENTGGATMGWALFYSTDSRPDLTNPGPIYPPKFPGDGNGGVEGGPGTTSGDCSSLVYAACGISFTGWETITVPSFLEPTNYYLVMWAQSPEVTTISNNTIFKARFGCGGATCALEESDQRITCNADGTYTVCQDYFGSAGSWDIAAPGASSIAVTTYNENGGVITNTTGTYSFMLGIIPDGAIKATICTTYPIGTPFNVTLTPNGLYNGGSDYVACMTGGSYSGTSPTVPTVTGTATPSTINLATGNTSSLTASASGGTGPYTYVWTEVAPDAFTSLTNGANGTGTFTVDAFPVPPPVGYDLQVTATDARGCAGVDDVQILIDATLAPCGIYGDQTVCAATTGLVYTYGDATTMTPYTLNTTNFAYKWTITGDGIITSEDDNTGTVTVSATGTGGFTLKMTVDNITGILPDVSCTIAVMAGQVSASALATDAACNAGNGSVALTVSGGTPPYTFLWSNGATTEDLASVPAGTYSVTVTDANGCTGNAQATVGQPSDLTASAVATDAACNGGNGSVALTVGGGTAPYTFLWSNGATTEDLASVPAGTYSVTVTDFNGCTETAQATVGQPTDLTASAVATDAACNGGNGSVALTVGGGTAPYTFLWSNGATTEDLASVPAGTYSVTVTDFKGCTETAQATVGQPTDLTASAVATDAACNGGNGSVALTVGGGTAPYTFLWSNGATTEDLASVPAGTYSVTVTDFKGCTETAQATVGQPTDLTASATATDATCSGNNGSVNLTVGGGTAPYTYLWSNGATTEDLASVPGGTYSVTVTDFKGCTETAQATVSTPSDITASAVATDAVCNGGNGSVALTVSGGTTPYTFLWSNGATTEDLASVPAGTYSVTVTDFNGCTKTAQATVGQPTDLTASAVATDAACNGGNGSVALTVGGGTAPYTFLWSNGATTEDLASVPAGTYSVTVTDFKGCTETAQATVGQPTDLTASAVATDAACNGGNGSVALTVGGGTAPYTFLWSNGATTEDLASVPAGTYSVTVTDFKGCTETAQATVGQPTDLTASAIATDATCSGNNGSVNLTVGGGTAPYTYLWSNGATTEDLASVPGGTYSVTVTDFKGCTETAQATVSTPSDITASAVATDAVCNGGNGSVALTVSGGTTPYTFLWSNGATTEDLASVPAGTYSVTVTDFNGCTETAQATVGQPADLTASAVATDAACNGGNGSVALTVGGGTAPYTFLWSNGATTEDLASVPAGTYSVTVTDFKGCTETAQATVGQPTDLTASAVATDAACNGGNGSVALTVGGGTAPYTFLWSNGATTEDLASVPAGTYSVTVTDFKGCTETAQATVGQPGIISCILTAPATSPNCATSGNLVTGTVSGGTGPFTCSASFDAAGSSAGWVVTNCAVVGSGISVTYTSGGTASTVMTVEITDSKGCKTSCTITVSCSAVIGKGCTPGFWKNHPNVWDRQTDFLVNNMPGSLTNPVTKGGTFVTTTNFYAYFNIPVGTCGLPKNASLTMLQATGTGGGNCNALARHGVSALLGAAAFPGEFPYPAGMSSFTDLYNAIRNAFLTCNCGPLHLKLAAINELDGEFCGALQKLPQVWAPTSTPTKTGTGKKEVSLKAYPNPYSSEVNFSIVSPESGQASLEVYDIVGRKLAVVYQGKVDANVSRTVNYQVPATLRETLIYKFTVNGKTVLGKLMPGSKTIINQP